MGARAAVVVTTYNQLAFLRLSLRGYLRQTTRDFDLYVADDGSTDDTARFLEAFRAEAADHGVTVHHVWQEDQGYRRARVLNEAVRRSAGEPLLIFSDGDCVPPASFVERHLAAHEPRSFQVAGRIMLSRTDTERLTAEAIDEGTFESWIGPEDRRDLRRRAFKSRIGVLLRKRNRPKIIGANVAFDRGLFEELNGYDENFEGWGYEDSDIRSRAMRLEPRPRVKILYGKNDVFHLHPDEVRGDERSHNIARYKQQRPTRCEVGLRDLRT